MAIEWELRERDISESDILVTPAGPARSDGYRAPATAVPIQCHVEVADKTVRNLAGEEVLSHGRAYLVDVYPWIDEHCTLTLPSGRTTKVAAVETTYGYNLDTETSGPYQTIVHFP